MPKTLIIAHRGASGYAPENTMASFQKAIEMGADGIEFDVQLSKDKKLVVCHDERVDRTTDGSGFIKDLTLDEIKGLNAGKWYSEKFTNERIPTLIEVLDLVKGKDILINIELKNGIIKYNGLEEEVISLLRKLHMEQNVIVSSFNHNSLIKIKKLNKNIKTGILYVAELINPFIYAKKLEAFSIHPIYYSVSSKLIEESHKHNISVNTYTVNEHEEMEKIIKAKVDGLITNYPDKGKKILQDI